MNAGRWTGKSCIMSLEPSSTEKLSFISLSEASRMEALYKISTWYAICFAVFFGFWIFIHIFSWLVRAIWLSISFHLLKHLFYPSLFHRAHFFGTPTRFNAVTYILYITINILCLVVRLKSATDLSDRAATMATINLIPLLCGRRLILMTELLGISLRSHLEAHKLFGTVMIVQVLLHTAIVSVKNSSTEWTWTSVNLSGVVVGLRNTSRITSADL
jgi:hypothetical protein